MCEQARSQVVVRLTPEEYGTLFAAVQSYSRAATERMADPDLPDDFRSWYAQETSVSLRLLDVLGRQVVEVCGCQSEAAAARQ